MHTSRQWISFLTIAQKEIKRVLRIWPQTLLPPAITMTLYFVIFGVMIGARVGNVGGIPYMQFIVPGLIMMAVITNSYSNVVSSFFSTKFNGSIEEMLISPMSKHSILMGFIIGGIFRSIVIALIVMGLALFFTQIAIVHIATTVITIVLTAILFSLAGMVNAVFARSFDDISIVPSFVLTPLTYLGGVFYAIADLPEFWQKISLLNPIVYIVNAFRYGLLGYSDVPVFFSMVMVGFFAVVFYALAYYLLGTSKVRL